MTSSALTSNSSPEIVSAGLTYHSLQLDDYCHQLRQDNNRWKRDGFKPISDIMWSIDLLAQGKFQATKTLEDSTKEKLDATVGLFQSRVIEHFEERVDHALQEGDKTPESEIIYEYDTISKKFSSLDKEGESLSRDFESVQTWQSSVGKVRSKLKSGQEKTLNTRLQGFTTTHSKPLNSSSSSSSSPFSFPSSSSSMGSSTSAPSKPFSPPPSYPSLPLNSSSSSSSSPYSFSFSSSSMGTSTSAPSTSPSFIPSYRFSSSTSPIPGHEEASSSPTSKTSSLLKAEEQLRSILEDVNEKRIDQAIQRTATLTTSAIFAGQKMTICQRVYFHNGLNYVRSADRFKSAIQQTLEELPRASKRTILDDFHEEASSSPYLATSQYQQSLETLGLWDKYQNCLARAKRGYEYDMGKAIRLAIQALQRDY
jgi:type II secretory pathway pseudopilin PulG